MNIGVHVCLSILVSSVCMPSSGIAESYFFFPHSVSAFILCVEEFECFLGFSLICCVLDYVSLYSLLGDCYRDCNKHINCSDYLKLIFYNFK